MFAAVRSVGFRRNSEIGLLLQNNPKKLIDRVPFHDFHSAFIADFKVGLNVDQIKISANYFQGKRMEGADIGIGRQIRCFLKKAELCGSSSMAFVMAAMSFLSFLKQPHW